MTLYTYGSYCAHNHVPNAIYTINQSQKTKTEKERTLTCNRHSGARHKSEPGQLLIPTTVVAVIPPTVSFPRTFRFHFR